VKEQPDFAQACRVGCVLQLLLQALIYTDMGDLALAYEKAQAALSMRQKVLAGDHPDLAHSLTGERSVT
jgi:hypothetical protein